MSVGPSKVLLVLMVKNEAAQLPRCLRAAAPFVDASFVFDTGSEDDTLGVARREGCGVAQAPWEDFGRSRTASLKAARAHALRELKWRLCDGYALVLDADMVLRGDVAAFRSYMDAALRAEVSAVALVQKMGALVYHNTRLMRLVDDWRCKGATHEAWTGGRSDRTALLDRAVLWIDDLGDGGCKHDKFERDERLLLTALHEDPGDARSQFYLAQTYKDREKFHEAIEAYEKRIAAGGWKEEVWYSHYGIVQCLVRLGRLKQAARRVKEAADVCSDRAEAAIFLATALRREGSRLWAARGGGDDAPEESLTLFKKAWRYLELCSRLPLPKSDRLFVEPDAYGATLHLEKSHLAYYGAPQDPHVGLVAALSCEGARQAEALRNAVYYARELQDTSWTRLHFAAPEGFKSSSVGYSQGRLCVRCVNYTILPDGSYNTPGGKVVTRNFLASWKGLEASNYEASEMTELFAESTARRQDEDILGLEDVRLFDAAHMTATTREFSYGPFNRIAWGSIRLQEGVAIVDFAVLRPPVETACEKNWAPLDAEHFVYCWHPLEVYRIEPRGVTLRSSQPTPAWFRHVRGSTPFVEVDGRLLGLVHVVLPHTPRVYLHCFVWLSQDWTLCAYSLPFVLRSVGIEYTLGLAAVDEQVVIFASCKDCESWMGVLPLSRCTVLATAWPRRASSKGQSGPSLESV
jgi:tetratricopeptide (TPR) repeat protein